MTVQTSRRRPLALALGIAGLALLIAAQPVLATTWTTEMPITTTESTRPQIVRTGPASAVIVWQHGQALLARRTGDSGQTWSPAVTVATEIAADWSVASSGKSVDLAWVRQVPSSSTLRLYYRRSLDGGATWHARKALTSATSRVADAAVARHSNGQVSVVFTGYATGKIYIRTSANGGTTFAAKKQLASTNNDEPGRVVTYRSDPAIAIAGGITYVSYTSDHDTRVGPPVSEPRPHLVRPEGPHPGQHRVQGDDRGRRQEGDRRVHDLGLGPDQGRLSADGEPGRDLGEPQVVRGPRDR